MFDISGFRQNFPEFTDPVKYPDSIITFWSDYATKSISTKIFGDFYDSVWQIVTAHYLVLATESKTDSDAGGLPGGNAGAISSKQVGSASVSFDAQLSSEPNAGHWNQTTYGRMFKDAIRTCAPHCWQL